MPLPLPTFTTDDLRNFPQDGQRYELLEGAEVFSPSSRVYDRDYKRDAYLSLGVDEVWLVDMDERVVFASRRGAERDVRHVERLVWRPAAMREPLEIDLASLFRGIS